MSNQTPRLSLAEKFIGADAADGPFVLLGVPHEADEHQIRRAMSRRLAQIDQHPHRRTPDADEARLAVHSAVSQLLDPELRSRLSQQFPPGVAQTTPAAWKPRKGTRIHPRVSRSARMVLGMCGGWNARSRRQLAHLARMNRIPAIELIRSLPVVSNHTHTRNAQQRVIQRVLPLPPGSLGTWFTVYATFAFMIALLVYQSYMPNEIPTEQESTVARSSSAITDTMKSTDSQSSPTPARSITHYTAIAHELSQAEKVAPNSPRDAVNRVIGVLPAFVELWTSVPSDELEAMADSLRVVWEAARADPIAEQMLRDAVLQYSTTIDPSELILTSAIRGRFDLPQDPGSRFSSDLANEADKLAEEANTDDPVWWSSWIHAVESIHPPNESDGAVLILKALDSRLRLPGPSPSWPKSASVFANTLAWRPGSAERVWLLGAFNDASVLSERLAPLTDAIATDSSASGILVTMALPPDATMQERAELGEQYRDAWARNTDDPFLDRLTDSLISTVSLTAINPDPKRASERFVELARLNAACSLHARGDSLQASTLYETPPVSISVLDQQRVLGLEHDPEDDRLALALINADSGDSELTVLYEIESQSGVGLNTAHAVVQIALTGSTRESREYAERLIANHPRSLTILLALDRVLTVNRTTARFQQIVASLVELPSVNRSGDWDQTAHAALLAAISDAAYGPGPDSNSYEQAITAYYAPRLSSPSPRLSAQRDLAILYVTQLGADAIHQADQETVRSVLQRRRVRLARAESKPQQFAADQWAIVELHAVIIENQLPGTSARVQQILEELRDRCAAAQTIHAQMNQLERAQAQLWLLRFREGRI